MDGTVLSARAVSIILGAIRDGIAQTRLADALEVGYKAFGEVVVGPAAREGIGAFLEKRRPNYDGI